jgi:mono/diheme cytochrome c family protein/uncharacterized membrane protein
MLSATLSLDVAKEHCAMRNVWIVALLLLVPSAVARCETEQVSAASETQKNAVAVRQVLEAKCAGCHGPDLEKPRGRFGYVLDLERVAANPEMVVPSFPNESELWVLVQRNEMPPIDSPHGPLSAEQKETIRAWIASGAPNVTSTATETVAADNKNGEAQGFLMGRILLWVGRFHLLAIHFPIALVLAAGVAEMWWARQHSLHSSPAVRFCLWLGALMAVPTATLGWLFAAAGNGTQSPQLLLIHRSLGTATAISLIVVATCAEFDFRRGRRRQWVRFLILAGAVITALTAHFGGLLVHGTVFFYYSSVS